MARDGDLYEVLGVARDAQPGAIKDAFREKAKSAHPDAGGDPEEFKRLSAAYAILAAPDKRDRYDRTGKADGADNKQAQALGMIQHLVTSIIDQMDDSPLAVDLIERMRESLRAGIERIEADTRDLLVRAKRADRLAKKFKVKKGRKADNFMRAIGKAKAREMREKIANGQKSIETATLALKILDDYEFEPDAEMVSVRMFSTVGMGSTATGGF